MLLVLLEADLLGRNLVTVMNWHDLFKQFPEFKGPATSALQFARKKQPKVYVYASDKVAMTGASYDYAKRVYIFRNKDGEVKTVSGGFGDSYVNWTRDERLAASGKEIDLSQFGAMCLVVDTIGMAELYVNPESVAPMLPGETEEKLNPVEELILVITKSLKSFARKENFKFAVKMNHLEDELEKYIESKNVERNVAAVWDAASSVLKENGYLKANGALSNKGAETAHKSKYRTY